MDRIGIKGVVTLHQLPENWTDEELRYWWEPETAWDEKRGWVVVRAARMSEGEKRSRLVGKPVENLITNAGIAQILNNLSQSGQGNLQPFAQILSIGNGSITGVARTDTGVSGDGFTTGARKAPASFSIVGFTTTVTTNFGSGDAVGTWTNGGYYSFNPTGSQNATTSSGTGQLATHFLYPFVKGAVPYAVNYVFSISN